MFLRGIRYGENASQYAINALQIRYISEGGRYGEYAASEPNCPYEACEDPSCTVCKPDSYWCAGCLEDRCTHCHPPKVITKDAPEGDDDSQATLF